MNLVQFSRISLLAITSAFGLTACDEGEHSVQERLGPNTDYRSTFTGIYVGDRVCTSFLLNDTATYNSSHAIDTLKVIADYQTLDSIWIDNWLVPISENGYYSGHNEVPGLNFFTVRFLSDSLEVQTNSGGLGGGTNCKWKAIKLK